MPDNIDIKDLDALAGAVYFSVGRGTEGGDASTSYRLSIAGVSQNEWGTVSEVKANSGYSMGAIQIDFGQRGTWPLGATEDRALKEGETTYVDAIIEQASSYAEANDLKFTDDLDQLRSDLLSHGNGQTVNGRTRSEISFIDTNTRDSINAWASSVEGKQWIHQNMDYAQVKNATNTAVSMLNEHPHTIPEDKQFQAVSILAKTANQFPSQLSKLESVLENRGDYDDLLSKAETIQGRWSFYAGPHAASVAESYVKAYGDPLKHDAMDRAHAKVSDQNYDPSTEPNDLDVQESLHAIGLRSKNRSYSEYATEKVQEGLNTLGYTDAKGQPLAVDGGYGPATKHALEAFQKDRGLPVDGKITPEIVNELDPFHQFNSSLDGIPPVDSSLPGRAPADGHVLEYLRSRPEIAPASQDEAQRSGQAATTGPFNDPYLDRYYAAVVAGDSDKADRIAREFTESPEGQKMVQEGNELYARQQQEQVRLEQEQAQAREQQAPVHSV